jgi:hypothetical protein
MVQSAKLTPNLAVLLPLFRERCARIQEVVAASPAGGISGDIVNELRASQLVPLSSPTKAQLAEELSMIAALSVTIDLVTQGWRIVSTDPDVSIEFSNGVSPEAEKERIRRAHLIDRDGQLRESAVNAFIKGMEKRRLTPKGWHSIFSVMRDGGELSRRMSEIREIENPETQAQLLERVVKPYIQFVVTDAVCEHTGLRLNDIWRYFRHTWVNSYKSVPGRSMTVLIRDAAAPCHPVIGIACLASSVVQQSSRDKWIGWDAESVVAHFSASANPKKHAAWLLAELSGFIKNIYLKDLLEASVIARTDLKKPTAKVVERLLKDSARAIKRHRLYPNASKHKDTSSASSAEWKERAETSLFRSKRAKQLATLLSIREVFQEQGLDHTVTPSKWKKLFENGRFRQAVGQIVRLVKAERVGICMMDIAVCGAIAPYNLLLGGKLVCLLLCSPEVVKEYERRYESQMSLIASSMRGSGVTRKAQLVLLCTTSLYGSALSQYSRVKVPTEILGGRPGEKVEFDSVGLSEGFGSFHFSKETLRLMAMLLGRSKEARKVNSIFGEGVNPLMRKIREALTSLGLPSEILLKHGNKRVVYGVSLARNFRDVLLGLTDSARYYIPLTRAEYRTELLADFWRQRWLLKRLEKPGILDEVSKHTVVYPIRHGAQVELPKDPNESFGLWD